MEERKGKRQRWGDRMNPADNKEDTNSTRNKIIQSRQRKWNQRTIEVKRGTMDEEIIRLIRDTNTEKHRKKSGQRIGEGQKHKDNQRDREQDAREPMRPSS